MCGIVGLLVKNPALRDQLGALMVPMLTGMTERGPDSAGLAVYTAPAGDARQKNSLYCGESAVDWSLLRERVRTEFGEAHELAIHHNQAVLSTGVDPDTLTRWLAQH